MASRKAKKLNSEVSYDAIEFFKLTLNRDFEKSVKELRDKYGINVLSLSESIIKGAEELEDEEQIFEYLIENSEFQQDIDNLLKLFGFSQGWHWTFTNYAISGNSLIIDSKFKPDGIQVIHHLEDNRISIDLGPDSTLQEIIDKWPSIEKHLNKKRKKKWENFRRDLIIFMEHKVGKSTKEIQRKLEEVFGESPSTYVITNAVYRYKQRMK